MRDTPAFEQTARRRIRRQHTAANKKAAPNRNGFLLIRFNFESLLNGRALIVVFAAHLKSVLILFTRGQSATNMAFGFIHIQNHPGLRCQGRVDVLQSVGNVLMYRGLGDPELFRCLPHRCIVVYNVIGDGYGPLFNVLLQTNPPEDVFYILCMT